MGADIHMIAEYRGTASEQWALNHCVNVAYAWGKEPTRALDVDLDRSYSLFSTLAGVRPQEDYPCLFPRRGVPDDMCSAAQAWWDNDNDLHSASWLSWPEAELCALKAGNSQLLYWLGYARMPFVPDDQQRIIFAFDN